MVNRRVLYSAVFVVAVLALAAGCSAASSPSLPAGGGPAGAQPAASVAGQSTAPATRGITVVGEGKASGTPDVAYVNIGVETQDASVQQAVSDNRTRMSTLLDALKALGIADNDIRTSNYSVFTERQPVPGPANTGTAGPITYHVNNQVAVTVRDVAKLGDVLDKTVAAGANNIYGVNFGVADPSKLQADARAKAIADAKARAQDLAQLTGVTLGDVLSVSEAGAPGPVAPMASAAMGMGGGTPIQPGELEVDMSVQITYGIK